MSASPRTERCQRSVMTLAEDGLREPWTYERDQQGPGLVQVCCRQHAQRQPAPVRHGDVLQQHLDCTVHTARSGAAHVIFFHGASHRSSPSCRLPTCAVHTKHRSPCTRSPNACSRRWYAHHRFPSSGRNTMKAGTVQSIGCQRRGLAHFRFCQSRMQRMQIVAW